MPNFATIFCVVVEKGELKDIGLKLESEKAQLNIHMEYFGLNSRMSKLRRAKNC